MGSIEPYETAAGRRYKVQFRKPDHSTTTKRGFPTKRAAQLFLAQAELHIAGGTWIDGQASRVTVAELGPSWLAAKAHLKPSSFHVLTTAWRIRVEPVWDARTEIPACRAIADRVHVHGVCDHAGPWAEEGLPHRFVTAAERVG